MTRDDPDAFWIESSTCLRERNQMFKITRISVLEQRHGPDIVSLWTDLPSFDEDPVTFDARVPKGKGYHWALTHFPGINVHVISKPKNDYKFLEDKP